MWVLVKRAEISRSPKRSHATFESLHVSKAANGRTKCMHYIVIILVMQVVFIRLNCNVNE
jgi:hypothetical protein